jgi:hypothetical protein
MIFVIQNKKYNTETSEKILEFGKIYKEKTVVGELPFNRETVLYRTVKGNWFTVAKGDFNRHTAYKENDESVKEILKSSNSVDIYQKYFEELEEA